MRTGRWRVELVEEIDCLPIPWRPAARSEEAGEDPAEIAKAAVVAAFELLSRRGPGQQPWAASFRHDPIAFLLDSVSDAVNLWGPAGTLLYRNRASEHLALEPPEETAQEVLTHDRPLQRRSCRFRCGDKEYVLEIIGQEAARG